MNKATKSIPSSASGAPIFDFRATAVALAGQLQIASRTALLMTDELRRAERMIEVLVKYMPDAQMFHAQLEIAEMLAASNPIPPQTTAN